MHYRNGKKITKHFYFDAETVEIIDNFEGSKPSAHVRVGVHLYNENKVIVFKIKNKVNHRVFFGKSDLYTYFNGNMLDKILLSTNLLNTDAREYGYQSFSIESVGIFPTLVEANEYLDFIINKNYDEGVVLYNQELYTGFTPKTITIPISLSLYKSFLRILKIKKTTTTKVITFLIKTYIKNFRSRRSK